MLCRRFAAFLVAALLLLVPVAALAASAPAPQERAAASWSDSLAQVWAFLARFLPPAATDGGVRHGSAAATGRVTLQCSIGMDPNGKCLSNECSAGMDPNGSCATQ